jgi:hypothetical protein
MHSARDFRTGKFPQRLPASSGRHRPFIIANLTERPTELNSNHGGLKCQPIDPQADYIRRTFDTSTHRRPNRNLTVLRQPVHRNSANKSHTRRTNSLVEVAATQIPSAQRTTLQLSALVVVATSTRVAGNMV